MMSRALIRIPEDEVERLIQMGLRPWLADLSKTAEIRYYAVFGDNSLQFALRDVAEDDA